MTVAEVFKNPADLILGAHFDHVDYCWRPYHDRPADHRADYDRLRIDLVKHGQKNPIIIWRDHVLIGMRRCEIAVALNWDSIFCWSILDDISGDANPDRVLALRDRYAEASY